MLFNSQAFLAFCIVFFPLYFLLKKQLRLLLIVVFSYFFYAWWDWRFLSLLIMSSLVDFWVGRTLQKTDDEQWRRRLIRVSVCFNLGLLGIFKYFDFFSSSLQDLLSQLGISASLPTLEVILPVGISFYTFQSLSYSIDVYRRRIVAEPNPLKFLAFVALFPQLLAGPIVRAHSLLPQMATDHKVDWTRIGRGVELIVWGFFLKIALADNAAHLVQPRFSNPALFGSLNLLVGVLAFAMQIYGDFAGYSLIAIGLARVMGFDFGVNFNRPYFSRSFSEFWTRWHISLSSWLRDYLYIELGGNREGRIKTYRNLIITMLLGGLWHGAAFTFVIWGLLHGFYLVVQRLLSGLLASLRSTLGLPNLLVSAVAMLTVFALTNVAWVFFRSNSVDTAVQILHTIFTSKDWAIQGGEEQISLGKTAFLTLVVLLVDALAVIPRIRQRYFSDLRLRIAGALSAVWLTFLLGVFEGNSFIYFQF